MYLDSSFGLFTFYCFLYIIMLCIMSLMDCRLYLMNCLQVYKKWKGKKKKTPCLVTWALGALATLCFTLLLVHWIYKIVFSFFLIFPTLHVLTGRMQLILGLHPLASYKKLRIKLIDKLFTNQSSQWSFNLFLIQCDMSTNKLFDMFLWFVLLWILASKQMVECF